MFETKEGVIKPIVYVGIVQDGRLLLVDYKEAPNPEKKGWWIPRPGAFVRSGSRGDCRTNAVRIRA